MYISCGIKLNGVVLGIIQYDHSFVHLIEKANRFIEQVF